MFKVLGDLYVNNIKGYRSLPTVDHWCIAGDFNMIEDPEDRNGEGGATVHGLELSGWERFTMKGKIRTIFVKLAYPYATIASLSSHDD